ncbi:hypothetical protein Cyagr_2560 [Cyanobium gracile PCC 6307]|uniref:PilZ domain-containing protein n=1 Tax=Cyanobium gracile (strain ATCC 27147 / PCC 6307) TaxID=292564 RepID=K9PAP1_CYAGP|nr:hypothetical protein Cyagr_2560 [Cyanobium gracile PCC 6307]
MLTGQSGSPRSHPLGPPPPRSEDRHRLGAWPEKRAFGRHPVERCRPIAIRRLNGEGHPCGRWFLADIVDVAEGGMGLIANEEQTLGMGQWILLDLHSHPDFGVQRLRARLRWISQAHFALTFGVAFASPLRELPVLSVERRSLLRDPNEEEWALEEERMGGGAARTL